MKPQNNADTQTLKALKGGEFKSGYLVQIRKSTDEADNQLSHRMTM